MTNEINGNVPDSRFWTSRKFWLTVLGSAIFLTLALTKTMVFTNTEAITVILALIGFNVGAHTITDIASLVTRRQGNSQVMHPSDDVVALVQAAFSAGLEEKLVDIVADVLEQLLPDQKDGGSSLCSSPNDDGLPVMNIAAPMPPVRQPKRETQDTPIETPIPRNTIEKEEDNENA